MCNLKYYKKIVLFVVILLILILYSEHKLMARDFMSNVDEFTLNNRMHVITYNKTTSNVCSVRVAFKLPISAEEKDKIGLRNLLIQVMTRNTKNYNSRELPIAIESIGGNISPIVSKDYIGVSGVSLCRYTPELINLIKDILYNPSFEGFEEEKNIAIQQSRAVKDIWSEAMELWIYKSLKTNYRYETIGYPDTINNIRKDDIINLYNKYFAGNNLVFVLAGNLDNIDNLDNVISELDIDKGKKYTLSSPVEPPLKENFYTENRNVDTSAFVLGIDAPQRKSDEYINWLFFSTYLSNKIDDEIRQKRGLAYSAASSLLNMISNSYLVIRSDISNSSNIDEALNIAKDYLTKKYIANINAKDFDLAKNMVIGSLSRSNQTSSEIASILLSNYLNNIPLDYHEKLLDEAEKVSLNDILSLQYVIPNKLQSIIEIIGKN